MEEAQLSMMKNLFNRLKLDTIDQIDEKTVVFDFEGGVRLFIDASDSAIDFSMIAMETSAVEIIDSLEENNLN